MIFNHVLSELYRCRTYQDLGDAFLPMLRMLIPYRYASIMRRAEAGPSIHLVDPLCVPAAFAEAERRYMRFAADDYTAWLSCCREATLFRESDLVGNSSGCAPPSTRSAISPLRSMTPSSTALSATVSPWGR
ncbi:MAG: hypothetical protein ACLR1T_10365 [Evtepia gabavorous]